jgi:hypothetical protein
MKYILAVCFPLFFYYLSQAQVTNLPPGEATHQSASQQCSDCSTGIEPALNQLNSGRSELNTELPDAPSSVSVETSNPFVWDLAVPSVPAKESATAPRPDPIWDKKAWAAQIFLVGTIIFDVEATHQGIAHHKCVEGNNTLREQPSRGELYVDNLKQFVPMVVMEGLGALALRHGHLPRWAWKAMVYGGPVYPSAMHLHGGIKWVTQCW